MTRNNKWINGALCGAAALALTFGSVNLSLAQSHEGHSGGGQHETSGRDHGSRGCSGGHESGGCGDDHDETSGGDHGSGGKGKMRGRGGIIRGHGAGAGHGDLHDIFDQMEDQIEGQDVTGDGGHGSETTEHGAADSGQGDHSTTE